MSFGLAREIYGRTAWAVDGETFTAYLSMVKDWRNGVNLANGDSMYNSTEVLNLTSRTKIVQDRWQAKDANEDDELIYIVNLDGPITRNGGMSSYGTAQLANMIMFFEALPNVIGGIVKADSGGGSTNAVEIIDSTIRNRTKPIVSLLEKGTIACSACYGSISGSDYIMSDGKNNKVGSLGTMADFDGVAHKNVTSDGVKTIRVYATKSTAKNKWYEEAVNNDNFEPLISELLDPENDIFLGRITANRPQILESQLDGSVYKSGDVIGTLIDGLGTIADAIDKVKELSVNYVNPNSVTSPTSEEKIKPSTNNNNPNLNPKIMTQQDLQSQHPTVYAAIYDAGVAAEADRQGAWMAHYATDPEAVTAGIASGLPISQKSTQEFIVKATQKGLAGKLEKDSAPAASTEEAPTEEVDADQKAANDMYAKLANEK